MKQWRRSGKARMIPSCSTYPSTTPLKITMLASPVAKREGWFAAFGGPYTKDKTTPRLVAAGHFAVATSMRNAGRDRHLAEPPKSYT
jgi:hypothetical protein